MSLLSFLIFFFFFFFFTFTVKSHVYHSNEIAISRTIKKKKKIRNIYFHSTQTTFPSCWIAYLFLVSLIRTTSSFIIYPWLTIVHIRRCILFFFISRRVVTFPKMEFIPIVAQKRLVPSIERSIDPALWKLSGPVVRIRS